MGQRGYLMESDEESVRLDMKTDVTVVEKQAGSPLPYLSRRPLSAARG